MPETPINQNEVELAQRTSRGRLFELDALRGLAAFTVVLYHFRLAYNYTFPVSHNPLISLLLSGHQAVVLFFVLSGYVLGLPVWAGRQMPYRLYLVRRFFRIYLPFFAALLLAWAFAHHFLNSALPLTTWFRLTWHTPLTWTLFLKEAGMSMSPALNTAFWSLRIEAEFSILLPVCCWLVLRLRTLGIALLCVIAYASSIHLKSFEQFTTVRYFPMFFIGLLLSLHAESLAAWWRKRSALERSALFLLALSLYIPIVGEVSVAGDALTGIGAALIILSSLHSQVLSRILRHRVPEYLGRISYSLYLVHGTVLFALLILLHGRVPKFALAGINCVCALLVAHLFCIAVEEPTMRLGKQMTQRFSKRLA